MLELRKYPKAELSALFGTRDTQGLKRKLERYGMEKSLKAAMDKALDDIFQDWK